MNNIQIHHQSRLLLVSHRQLIDYDSFENIDLFNALYSGPGDHSILKKYYHKEAVDENLLERMMMTNQKNIFAITFL